MIKGIISKSMLVLPAMVLLFTACRKREELSLADNYVVFETNAQGIPESDTAITIKLKLIRGTDKQIPVTINVAAQNAVYGVDYTTEPATANGSFSIAVPEGNNEAVFTVKKVPGTLYDGDEKLTFSLYSSGAPVLIGTTKELTLNFSELVATNSTLMINGGGATFPNNVFIDLSANRQTNILRTNWDLGFYTAADSFYAILNSSTAMMVRQINKNDLNAVTAADTIGFSTDVAYSPFNPLPSQMAYVDYPNGDITRTAIGQIAATASDNKVFIVNRGVGVGTPAPARGWKKIRILRTANGGYTLQHADIAATSFTSVEIAKDDAYFFKYVSFENGVVPVAPAKKKWDIGWSYFGNAANFGAGESPYMYQDIVIQNRNVAVAKVLSLTKDFEAFTEANLTDGTISAWNTSQLGIGADWRKTTPAPASANSDRYYIIRDGDNNYYKVKFTDLTDGGVRGYPRIAYKLVKRG